MSKLYVFAIGGSGTRVLKSLVMLLGSGMHAHTERIIPMIIDTDVNNGDLEHLRKIIKNYRKIHDSVFRGTSKDILPNSFFRTEIDNPKELNIKGTDFGTLENMINFSALNSDGHSNTKALTELLFTSKSRSMNLEKGFLGTPNVGSIVLRNVVESKGFKEFTQEFKPGDRIFIIRLSIAFKFI